MLKLIRNRYKNILYFSVASWACASIVESLGNPNRQANCPSMDLSCSRDFSTRLFANLMIFSMFLAVMLVGLAVARLVLKARQRIQDGNGMLPVLKLIELLILLAVILFGSFIVAISVFFFTE